jgi:hypothetical protein
MALSGASCKTAPGPTCVSPCEAVSQNGVNCACKSRTCGAPGLTLLFKVEYKSVTTAEVTPEGRGAESCSLTSVCTSGDVMAGISGVPYEGLDIH